MYSFSVGLELIADLDVIGELLSLSSFYLGFTVRRFFFLGSDRNLRDNPGYR